MKPAAPVAAEARISDMQATEEFLTSVLELLRRQIRLMLSSSSRSSRWQGSISSRRSRSSPALRS